MTYKQNPTTNVGAHDIARYFDLSRRQHFTTMQSIGDLITVRRAYCPICGSCTHSLLCVSEMSMSSTSGYQTSGPSAHPMGTESCSHTMGNGKCCNATAGVIVRR